MSKKPEFKWGEEVEFNHSGEEFFPAKYVAKDPINEGSHIIAFEEMGATWIYSVNNVRKPQQITLTLSQIAEKFNVKKELIKIVE